jgi:hypothetical protein
MPTNFGTDGRITRTAARTVTRTVAEQFLALICSDEDLLRAEFDAIIAAEWPDPPANTPGRGSADGRPARGAPRRALDRGARPVARPQHPGTGGWARQRSPPTAAATTHDPRQEGR